MSYNIFCKKKLKPKKQTANKMSDSLPQRTTCASAHEVPEEERQDAASNSNSHGPAPEPTKVQAATIDTAKVEVAKADVQGLR